MIRHQYEHMPEMSDELGRICIPTTEENGLESRVSEHFGRAPYHVMVDLGTRETMVLKKEVDGDRESHGHCMPVDRLLAHGVRAVACKGIGRGALDRLMAGGIEVFGTRLDTVGAVVDEYRSCRRSSPELPRVCAGHQH